MRTVGHRAGAGVHTVEALVVIAALGCRSRAGTAKRSGAPSMIDAVMHDAASRTVALEDAGPGRASDRGDSGTDECVGGGGPDPLDDAFRELARVTRGASSVDAGARPPWPEVRVGHVVGIIVHDERSEGAAPSPGEIEDFEHRVASFIASQPGATPRITRCLDGYVRQYESVLARGRRVLYVRFACVRSERATRHRIDVDDGGDCYFEVVFDPVRHRFLEFDPHGNA